MDQKRPSTNVCAKRRKNTYADIGNRIKLVRKRLKLSQSEFVKPLGVDRSHIAGIENGSRNPSEPLIKLIHLCYCVNLTWLKTGQGRIDMTPTEIKEMMKNQVKHLSKETSLKAIKSLLLEHES